MASLSGQDLNRRRFPMESAFAVTGFAQPALFALTLPAEANVARQHGRRVGAEEALTAGRAAIISAAPIASVRTLERLRTLRSAAGSAAPQSRYVRDLHAELTQFLTEQPRRGTEESSQ